jgi:hypothetical protein
VFEIAGGQLFQQMPAARTLGNATIDFLYAQPAASDVAVDVLPAAGDLGVEEFQGAFLDTCLLAATVLATSGLPFRARINAIVRTAASATPTGQLLREMFTDPSRQIAPLDPPVGGLPHLPGIDPALLLKIEELQQKGCINAVKSAMSRFGAAVAEAAPAYVPVTIQTLSPRDACSGEELTITGRGFGDGIRMAVAFTRADGGVTLVQSQQAREWTDTRIRVLVPADAVRGPAGILRFPLASTPIGTAAGQAMAELGTCFGPTVIARASQTIGGFEMRGCELVLGA